MSKKKSKKQQIPAKTASNKQKTVSSQPKWKFEFNKASMNAFVVGGIFLLIYMLAWTLPKVSINNPWTKASSLIDSGVNKTKDPILKNKLIEEGGEMLKELIKKFPFHARVQCDMAYYYYVKNMWDSSRIYSFRAFHMDSGSTSNQIWGNAYQIWLASVAQRGMQLYNEGKYDEARAAVWEAWQRKLADVNIYKVIGSSYFIQNNLDSALYFYQIGMQVSQKDCELINNIGVVYERMNKLDQAREYFQKALAVDPNYEKAKANLALIKREKNSPLSKGD